MKRLSQLIIAVAVLFLTVSPGIAQETVPAAEDIPVGPPKPLSKPLTPEEQRQELEKELKRLVVRQSVILDVREKMGKIGVTTAADINKVIVLDILMMDAMVEPLNKVTEAMEDYRFSIILDKTRKVRAIHQRQADIGQLTQNINRTAEMLVTGQDAAGRPLTPTQISNLRKLVTQHSKHRQSLEQKCERYQASIDFFEQELEGLNTLDEQLEGVAVLGAAHLEYDQDLLEDNQEQMASEELMLQQESLKRAIDIFLEGDLPDFTPPMSEDTPEKRPTLTPRPEVRQPELTEEENAILEQELKAARERLGLDRK